jgi:hypothetical protein
MVRSGAETRCADRQVEPSACQNAAMRNSPGSSRSPGSSGSILSIGSSGSILSVVQQDQSCRSAWPDRSCRWRQPARWPRCSRSARPLAPARSCQPYRAGPSWPGCPRATSHFHTAEGRQHRQPHRDNHPECPQLHPGRLPGLRNLTGTVSPGPGPGDTPGIADERRRRDHADDRSKPRVAWPASAPVRGGPAGDR